MFKCLFSFYLKGRRTYRHLPTVGSFSFCLLVYFLNVCSSKSRAGQKLGGQDSVSISHGWCEGSKDFEPSHLPPMALAGSWTGSAGVGTWIRHSKLQCIGIPSGDDLIAMPGTPPLMFHIFIEVWATHVSTFVKSHGIYSSISLLIYLTSLQTLDSINMCSEVFRKKYASCDFLQNG